MSAGSSDLSRRLGLRGAVTIGVGAMLGTGVFAVWTPAVALSGSALLASLAIAAIIAALNAASTARLAADLPVSGGAYAYGRAHISRTAGLVAGYAFILGKSASASAAALTIGLYLSPENARVIAVSAVVVMLLLDLQGITRSTRVTTVLIIVVVTVLAVLVVMWWRSQSVETTSLQALPTGSLSGVVAGAGLVFVAFAGYARITVLGAEVRSPQRNIPRAVAISFVVVLMIYLVIGLTVLSALSELGGLGDAALDTVARQVGGEALALAVTVAAVMAAGAVLLSLIAGIGRTLFAMSSHGDAPAALRKVGGRSQIPTRGSMVAAAIAVGIVLIGGLGEALAVSGSSILIYYAVAHVAAWRRFRRWPSRLVAGLGLVGCVVVAVTVVAVSLST